MERNGARESGPSRALWLTATLTALGIVGGPLALLGLAVVMESLGLDGGGAVGAAFGVYAAIAAATAVPRATRPLGLGMLVGSLAVVLMFLVTGGTR